MERFQPIIGGERYSGEGAGGTIRFLIPDIQTECDSGSADPRRRRGGLRLASLRLPDGHLPHMRRAVLLPQGPRPPHGRRRTEAPAR